MDEFAQLTFNGLVTGAVIDIAAIGLALVLAVLDIGSFAHGDYLTFGAYIAFGANVALGQSLIVGVLLAIVATAVLGIVLDVVVIQRFRHRSGGTLFIVTLGLALALRYSIFFVEGPVFKVYNFDANQVYDFGLIRAAGSQLICIVAAVVSIAAVAAMLARTRLGKQMRALAGNRDLAAISAVDIRRMRYYTWAISSGLAGLGGVLQALVQTAFSPTMGWDILFLFFTAVILGGIGSAYGTLVGGLVLGLSMELSTWSGFLGGIPSVYKPVVAYVVLLALLLFRPQGLFGRARLI